MTIKQIRLNFYKIVVRRLLYGGSHDVKKLEK